MKHDQQLPAWLTSQRTKYILVGLIAFWIGVSIAPTPEPTVATQEPAKTVTETKTVYRTPQACKEALSIDNDIFLATSEALTTFEFDPLTKKIESVTDRRTNLYSECVEG